VRRTKIVATLGPATADPAVLRDVLTAGVDVARLNFSHGTADDHRIALERVHALSRDLGRTIGSIGDLQGPKIRLGTLPPDGIMLHDDSDVTLCAGVEHLEHYDDGAGGIALPVVYPGLARDVEPGSLILIDDGSLRLVVREVDGNQVIARVVAGGLAFSRKGVNLPGVQVSATTLTDKDRADVATMAEIGVDWIALSFVRRPADIVELRQHITAVGGDQPIIAKLERPEAVDELDAIVAMTDAVMVARGDLGVEIGPERVPAIQKQMIEACNTAGRPVITATEMLDSMIRNPRPTRAEASDVANAIFDGTDAVMLSAETAAGRYPVQAVQTMARIIEVAEASGDRIHRATEPAAGTLDIPRVVAKAAEQVANDINAAAILVFSMSGLAVQLVSKRRPHVPIVGLTATDAARRRTALMWGVESTVVTEQNDAVTLVRAADAVCLSAGYGQRGDHVVIISGPAGEHGGTNRVLVHRLGDTRD
jgi:pyruvate kinase